ncbi:MAG: amidohydrolase family protein, partial [Planctomycetaceae bacterium]|nr:amidohydrolase family protein [Planctomycetaceae bacterium]
LVRVTWNDNQITSVEKAASAAECTADMPWLGPGLFDIQVNGYHGLWFGSETLTVDDVRQTILELAAQGIAECFPTLVTNSNEAIEHGMRTVSRACEVDSTVAAIVRGIHLEGPWISSEDGPRGAHPREHVRSPNHDEWNRWQRAASGRIRLVTLAPEVPGALDFIPALVNQGVVVSIGHTAANGDQIRQAADRGARLSTHLGNGAAGMMPRHPNLLWEQLAEDRLWASVISDGWHLPQATLQCMLRCKTLTRMVITCDVSGFGGCAPGEYREGGLAAEVLEDGRIVSAGQRQYLAGSGATTGECVIRMAEMTGISLEQAWGLASRQPHLLFAESANQMDVGSPATLTLFGLTKSDEPAATPTVENDNAACGVRLSGNSRFIPIATVVNGCLVAGTLTSVQ